MMTIIQQLHFIRPEFFWLLPLVLMAIFSLHLLRSKSSQWYDVIDPLLIEHLLDNPANNQASRRSSLPLFAAALACCIAIIAMAGPSWEKLPNVTEQKTDAMIILADLTLSMHATDVKPSRLVRTRYKLLELLKQRKAGQTALIAYSGDAHVVSPLTDDASTIAALIPSLSPDIMPSIGSNAVAAFNSATQLLKNSGISRAKIVWFTDEALPSDINAIDNILNSKSNSSAITGNHYQLMIIGIGSKAGGPIPLPSGKFIKDTSGRIVNAPLSRGRLKDIAANAGGVYFDLQSDNSDINAILSESLFDQINNKNNTPQQQNAASITDSWRDRGAYIALILLPFALLAFRRGWILGLMLTINISYTDNASADVEESIENNSDADTFQWIDLWQTADQQAYALERQQQHEQAAKQFENPEWKGVAEYQAGNYEDALQTLSALADKNDNDTSHYNHGHALARNNDLAGAIAAYDKALAINPEMENAKLAKSIVEALQQQQEQQQQDGEEGEEGEKGEKGEKNNEQQSSDQQESSDSESSESSSDESDSSQQGSESDSEASNELLDRQANQTQEQDTEEEQQSQQQKNQQAADEQSEEEAAAAASKQAAEAKEDTEGEAASLEAIEEQLNAEQQAQLEQWLKKIPDDPGGLLRRKFQYERSVRERQGNVVDDREQGQLW